MTVEDVVRYPAAGLCMYCRYWSPLVTRIGVGSCKACGCDGVVHPHALMAVSSRDDQGVYLVTSADFGCVMFREQS